MAYPTPPHAGWAPDPWDPLLVRYWDGQRWTGHTAESQGPQLPTRPGWFPDPEQPQRERFWSGTAWGDTRTKVPQVVWILLLGFLTLQGCGTSMTQAPTCHPGGDPAGVSSPASTPFAATVSLWLLGVGVALAVAVVWTRRRWHPVWLAWALVAGAVFLPFVSWFFAGASCGL